MVVNLDQHESVVGVFQTFMIYREVKGAVWPFKQRFYRGTCKTGVRAEVETLI